MKKTLSITFLSVALGFTNISYGEEMLSNYKPQTTENSSYGVGVKLTMYCNMAFNHGFQLTNSEGTTGWGEYKLPGTSNDPSNPDYFTCEVEPPQEGAIMRRVEVGAQGYQSLDRISYKIDDTSYGPFNLTYITSLFYFTDYQPHTPGYDIRLPIGSTLKLQVDTIEQSYFQTYYINALTCDNIHTMCE